MELSSLSIPLGRLSYNTLDSVEASTDAKSPDTEDECRELSSDHARSSASLSASSTYQNLSAPNPPQAVVLNSTRFGPPRSCLISLCAD